jgi:hypothetical protein
VNLGGFGWFVVSKFMEKERKIEIKKEEGEKEIHFFLSSHQ